VTTLYPSQLDNSSTLPLAIDNSTPVSAIAVNAIRNAVVAVEGALGTNPASIYGTVGNRLTTLEIIVSSMGASFVAGGDLSGSATMQTVIGLHGYPVSSTAPTTGYILEWSGSAWTPSPNAGGSGFTAGGDLSGTSSSQIVKGLYNHSLSSTAPVSAAVPIYNTSLVRYDVRQLTQDDIAPGFAISSFTYTGTSVVEFGTTITNPAFTASYTSTPSSASIDDNRYSLPTTLSPPYTTVTAVNSYPLTSSLPSVVFTLTAISSTTKTATVTLLGEGRSYGGVGTAGATSATSSGGTTATLVGATGTLSNEGLHSSDVGQSYGPFSPSTQKIYLLLLHTGSPHVFHDQNGFLFVMNTPTPFTFFNQLGSSLTMDLYESSNLLSTPFTISVVS